MVYEKICYSVENGIATVLMNYPKNLNAMDEQMILELVHVFEACDANSEVHVVVLKSAAKAFSAGGDISFMYNGIKNGGVDFGATLKKAAFATRAMKKCRKPVVGVVNGAAAGGGFMLVLACDYVIAAENAAFSAAFVNIGLMPDSGGFYLMTRAMSVNKATELALTGRTVRAEEARQIGFVAEIVPVEDLDAAAAKVAKKFAAGPALSYAKQKELLYQAQFSDFDSYIVKEVEAQLILVDTEDFRERVCAFVEKR